MIANLFFIALKKAHAEPIISSLSNTLFSKKLTENLKLCEFEWAVGGEKNNFFKYHVKVIS